VPTIRWIGPYRFFFFALDRNEPPHVHVARDDGAAKIWLEPVRLAGHRGFSAREITRIMRLVTAHRTRFLEEWHEFFSS
jgi:hypothetical protein